MDFLLIDSFNNETLKLSKLLIRIFNEIGIFTEFLVGYQDTTCYVEWYQEDRDKALLSSGIVVTKENLKRNDLFYTKYKVNVYFNDKIEKLGKYYNDSLNFK